MGGARPAALLVLDCLLLLQPLLGSPLGAGLMCHEEERSALLGFKKSFFNESHCLSSDDGNRPRKMMTWKDEEGEAGDCCNWGGIKCQEEGGHVIGLDLSEVCLSGRIDSEATIFNLVHLEELSLAYDSFDGSPFPTALCRLTRLTRLNLSSTGFAGEVVPELTKLRNLSSLDLSWNGAMNASSLEVLLQSLNKLEELDLSEVRVSDGKVPRSLGNMTSLRSLVLHGCGLSGRFPDSIFELPQLEYLDLSLNHGLTGILTGFYRGSPIKSLRLSETNFSGNLPVWLGNLSSLAELDVMSCGFWGEIPYSMGELTKLEYLNLASNNFHGRIPASFGNLISLAILDLHGNRLTGEIPFKIGNCISMVELDVRINDLTGEIPPSLGNLTQLQCLFLHSNKLSGEIPSALTKLPRLHQVGLAFNMFTGNVPPEIGNLTELIFLGLANNMFHGQLPDSIFRLQNLKILNLRSNHLIGMPRLETNVSEPTMWYLDLSFNDIEGMVPIPPYSVSFFLISNNRLSGEIPPSICLQNNIIVLDLSDNRLDGGVPSCFGNFSASLSALSLSGNIFSGRLPEFHQEQCGLITMDLSSNSFEGALPRSIASCPMLGYVNFGKNKIMDTFPAWLGSLHSLKVLMLHSNKFHGVMKVPANDSQFPSMRVLTLSENNMEGRLPAGYFARWQAMKHYSPNEDTYPDSYLGMIMMTIIHKGIEREFGKTLESFKLLDLSSNNFSGTIPKTIGHDLQKLHTLNLSNIGLSGPIPLSLSKFDRLEVLDLSRNKLSGTIPVELKQITSLNYFNVSRNNLSGPIPMGNQFNTFENTSYTGNPWLCGYPLTMKCGDPLESPASPSYEKSSLTLGIVWIATLVGLAGGLVMGVALEQAFGNDVLRWLMRKLQQHCPVLLNY